MRITLAGGMGTAIGVLGLAVSALMTSTPVQDDNTSYPAPVDSEVGYPYPAPVETEVGYPYPAPETATPEPTYVPVVTVTPTSPPEWCWPDDNGCQ